MERGNLFEGGLPENGGEVIEELVRSKHVRIERIVSRGHVSPPGFWYDQAEEEWVAVVRGSARLRFEDKPEEVVMSAGDCVRIPAHARHRVERTDPKTETVWLAVFYTPDQGNG